MATNQAVWQAWNEQRDGVCDQNGIHILDEDCKHGCSHSENTGNIFVLHRGTVKFRRCNIFFCPHAVKVNKRANEIQAT